MTDNAPAEGFAPTVDYRTEKVTDTPVRSITELEIAGVSSDHITDELARLIKVAQAVAPVIAPGTEIAVESQDIYTARFWKRTLDRALKSFAYTLSVMLSLPAFTESVAGSSALSIPWQGALTGALLATVLSVLGSVGGRGFGNTADPSWINTK